MVSFNRISWLQKPITTQVYLVAISISIVSLVFSDGLFHIRQHGQNPTHLVQHVNERMAAKDKEVIAALDWFTGRYNDLRGRIFTNPEIMEQMRTKFAKQGLAFFVYSHNELIFWSDNSIPIPRNLVINHSKGVMELGNGWYFFRANIAQGYYFVVLATIKTNFTYQNRFLVNRFQPDFDVAQGAFFISLRPSEGHKIQDSEGEYVFSLVQRSDFGISETLSSVFFASLIFAVFGVLLFLLSTYRYFSFRYSRNKKVQNFFLFITIVAAARILLQVFSIPNVFYESLFFSPSLYATSVVLPSLGDFLLHLIFVGSCVFFIQSRVNSQIFKTPKKFRKHVAAIAALLGIVILTYLSATLLRSLVIDSRLALDVNLILDFDWYNAAGFFIIAGIFFVFFFGGNTLLKIVKGLYSNTTHYWVAIAIVAIVLIALGIFFVEFRVILWLQFASLIIVNEVSTRFAEDKYNFSPIVLALFLFSAIGTFALFHFNGLKEQEMRKSIALRLSTDQDLMAEYLFADIEDALLADRQLATLIAIDPHNSYAIEKYLKHHYFYDFWGNYNLHVMVCLPQEILFIRPQNIEMPCQPYFEQYIDAFGRPTISENLIYIESVPGRNHYISILKIPVTIVGGFSFYYLLILEFDSKHVIRDLGLPELLIDDRIDVHRELASYSYATYYDGELVNKFGPFAYSINISSYGNFQQQFESFYSDDFNHIVYRKDESTKIVISKPVATFLESIAPFSLLFILFFFLTTLYFFISSKGEIFNWFRLTFKRRVQVFMIVLVILSAFTIGTVSSLFMADIYSEKTLSDINDKTTSTLIELERQLAGQSDLASADTYQMSDLLMNLYNILFTDINLFDANGNLVASSRPRVFEEHITAPRMNPKALSYFRQGNKSQLIHNEQIGEMNFLSSYVPLRNRQHDLLGYINLPYFDRQGEIRREVLYFMLAFVNINLLLLFFAIILALFVSKYITRPLELIRYSISRLQLGGVNTKITWERDDEIGQMVKEYNRMIDELSVSADLLAKSERELAWREMAKQVAHEIKNPLTPMKLSIQHLKKAYDEQVPDWDKRLQRFSKTMVEQIDNLAQIAGEFSDFAKMPSSINGLLDLRTFVPDIMEIYSGIDKVKIEHIFPNDSEQLWVIADKNQLLRVFNNLLHNSIQSYSKEQTAIIQIIYEKNHDFVKCHVKDFGCGIPEKLKSNIFSPNFTTKTSGMGLGLSMVKAIVENMGGSIWFQSEENQGTTMTFTLPAHIEKHENIER